MEDFNQQTRKCWESQISINPFVSPITETLGSVEKYLDQDDGSIDLNGTSLSIDIAVALDRYALPCTQDREGYWGENHFKYWASGLQDYLNLKQVTDIHNVSIRKYLDLGCASGRVLRHAAIQDKLDEVYGCDINRRHIDWIIDFLPKNIIAFHNHSLPSLPLPDNSVDLISAFSVFTHVDTFDLAWLMELCRILTPGGMAWITVHTEVTWKSVKPNWPLYKALKNHPDFIKFRNNEEMPTERLVFRWHDNRSYSANVFIHTSYIKRVWSRIFKIVEIRNRFPRFQDVVILQKV